MIYDAGLSSVVLSADELSALANKTGSIDCRHPARSQPKLADYDDMSVLYREEMGCTSFYTVLSSSRQHDGLTYTVSSLADAVVVRDGTTRVDLVRSVRKYDFYVPPSSELMSLLYCNALFVAQKKELASIRARIYYICKDGENKHRQFDYYLSRDELETHFAELIGRISFRGSLAYEHSECVLPSAAECVFPYESLREGQEIMIKECYSAVKQGKRIFLQAPTGTGKTVASLYPAVRALGHGLADKIFYLTSKASTRREAFSGASRLFSAGAMLRTVTVGAKEQVCLCGPKTLLGAIGNLCNPVDCEYARNYYDRVEGALRELISLGHGYTQRQIAMVARKHCVCPYELSLDLSELCDIIICDYNYVFDPSVYFRRYFGRNSSDKAKYVFLVDEAHNLADRARDMYSATLDSQGIESIYSLIDARDKKLNDIFERVILTLRAHRKLCNDTLTRDPDGTEHGFYISNKELSVLPEELSEFSKKCDVWLKENREHELWHRINSLMSDIKKYLVVSEYFDERFYNYILVDGKRTIVKIYCLDPSYILHKIEERAVSTIMFSATLTPPDYFSEILGGDGDSVRISLPSPFDASKLCVAVAGHISTRFEDRPSSYARYASVIAATVSRKHGNYIAYFPSYKCLEGVYSAFTKKYPDVSTVVQERGMTLSQKESFLNFFKNDEGILRIGFCVLGGSFAEGVDLPGARLIGSIIFGVGLPGLSNEKNIMREYYDNRGECGYDYAYTFPGMNNVLQAAGRVIRRDEDVGVVVLADDRYREEKYRDLFPEHWEGIKYANNASELAGIIQKFWGKADFGG